MVLPIMAINRNWTEQFFRDQPVFRTSDLVQASPTGNRASAHALIGHHRETGRIRPVRQGMWFAPRPGGAELVDPVLVAGRLTPDSVVCLHTAAELLGSGYSQFSVVTCFTSGRIKPFRAGNTLVRPVPHPRRLLEIERVDVGTESKDLDGQLVRVTTRERTLVDMLDRQDLSGGIEEVWRTAEQLGWLDDRVLLEYLALRGSPVLVARVGYLVEQQPDLQASDDLLVRLDAMLEGHRGPFQFAPGERGPRRFSTRWRLRIPESVATVDWEEPGEW